MGHFRHNWKSHFQTSMTSRRLVRSSWNLVCDLLEDSLTKLNDELWKNRKLKNVVILWRRFDALSMTSFEIWEHVPESHSDKEHFNVGVMSITLLDRKLWQKVCFELGCDLDLDDRINWKNLYFTIADIWVLIIIPRFGTFSFISDIDIWI